MHVIRLHRHGTPDVLAYEEVATPQPGPDQLLIRVESAAVNYADLMRRRNDPYPFPTPLPFVPGGEVAGTVAAHGAGVEGPPLGTPVFAVVGDDGSNGYAQFAVANAPQVVPIPPGIGTDEASALMIAGTTAMLVLTEAGRVQPGETVLLPGAAGGVGSYAVQIAKLRGATVIGAASTPAKREAALSLGADHVVDSTHPDWPDHVRELTGGRGADVVVESAGGGLAAQSLSCLAPFGRLVVSGMTTRQPLVLEPETVERFFYNPALNQTLTAFNLGLFFGLRPQVAAEAIGTLLGFVASGQVKVQIGHVLPLRQAAEAHGMLERREAIGKIVLKPWGDA